MALRVLWVIRGLGPGGAEHLLLNQARVADGSRISLTAAYQVTEKCQLVPELERHGVHVVHVGESALSSAVKLRRLLKQADVVHVHSPLLAAKVRLLRTTIPHGRPRVVTTEHNSWDAFRAPTRVVNAVTAWMDDARVAVSDAARTSMWRPLRASTEVVNHGVDVADLQPGLERRERTRRALGIARNSLLVVTVANYRVHKDYPNLLRAAVTVRERSGVDVRFVAVGQGPLESEITQLHADLGLADTFTLTGFRPDARDIIAAADLFVMASRQEGRPVALMEALALGRPVVVTEAGGMPEMVRDGVEGVVVPIGDSVALAEGILRLVQDEAFRTTAADAAAERGRQFDIAVAQRRLEDIYEAVVADLNPTAHQ